MDELIWKQDAINACGGMCACTQDCIDEIRKVPPVDAVEVVRCKDCMNCYSDGYCPEIERDVDALFFCENGVRALLGGEDCAT